MRVHEYVHSKHNDFQKSVDGDGKTDNIVQINTTPCEKLLIALNRKSYRRSVFLLLFICSLKSSGLSFDKFLCAHFSTLVEM